MQYQFGYNCSNFIPYFKKCRVHVDGHRKREDLVEKKELKTNEIMIYLGLSEEDLLEKVKTGEIKFKKEKKSDGSLTFNASVAFKYDDCPLANNAGLCNYYAEHNEKKISCLMELAEVENEHPNTKIEPSEACVLKVEQEIKKLNTRM